MDQLAQRLRTKIPFVWGGTHSDGDRSSDHSNGPTVMDTGRVTRQYVSRGFDPPEIEAYSKRAHRHLETLQDITIEEDNIQDEDEGEDEPLDETFAQEEACELEEELQDQVALAEFFNM
ncbi:hypothetical protein R1flu_020784 [Riccia fluitans]|uniref:Uncharacterized protein n=1 Tax=Riccia fluitans TaxID=41844 RepID=A0ABD1ZPJ9_9MARC